MLLTTYPFSVMINLMQALATAAETTELMEWLKTKSSPSLQPVASNASSPGHLEDLLPDLPPARSTAEQQNSIDERKGWHLKSISVRHREIMRRLLEGANIYTIAEEMNLQPQSIHIITNSPLFKAELAKLESERDEGVIRRAENIAGEALDTLKNQMRFAKSEGIRNRAANDILDRAGYSKIEKKLIVGVNAEEVIKELNRQRREFAEPKVVNGGASGE